VPAKFWLISGVTCADMGAAFSQWFFIPKPTLTGDDCPDQAGRVCGNLTGGSAHHTDSLFQVFIVTGGYTGIGVELCNILYHHNAVVYIAGRSLSKASNAISRIRKNSPNSKGRLEFLPVDLMDLRSIKPCVDTFLAREQRLDVLVNNAGVSAHTEIPCTHFLG
jgi:retinol dehydrogenase 12